MPAPALSLKQRILGRHGHLSNEAAAEAAEQLMSAELRHLYLGHLSRECNKPDLAFKVMQERLTKIGATHVRLQLTSQHVPCPTLHLGNGASQQFLPLSHPAPSQTIQASPGV